IVFEFDATPPDVETEMKVINQQLQALAPYLGDSKPLNLPAPWHGREASAADGHFTILLNLSPTPGNWFGTSVPPYGVYAVVAHRVLVQTRSKNVQEQIDDLRTQLQKQSGQIQFLMQKIGVN